MKCMNCDKPLAVGVRFCDGCGWNVAATRKADEKRFFMIACVVVGFLVLVGGLFAVGLATRKPETESERIARHKCEVLHEMFHDNDVETCIGAMLKLEALQDK